ncbi:hypothetical protein VTK73DRAFT_8215 [Phialemonium thermophilum]|uniref:6-phosphogluconolactonase n=1 Tax=Phialemonium thermophilum TaxID=223376 RepID=A0ABR3W9W5_9PEZI
MPPVRASFLALLPVALAANLLVSHYSGNLYSLSLGTEGGGNGTLSIQQTLRAGGVMPSWLTLDAASGSLYVTDESNFGGSSLTQLSVSADGTLQTGAVARASGGELHSCLYGGSDGKGFLAAAEYDPSSISTWKLPLSSSTQSLQRMTFTMDGRGPVPSRQDKPHPHSTFTDPTGQFLLSADLGADLIRVFRIDADTGHLASCGNFSTGPGDGPRHGAWWIPGGTNNSSSSSKQGVPGTTLYIVNELANSVTVWQVTYSLPSGGASSSSSSSSSSCLTLSKTQSIPTHAQGVTPGPGSKAAEVQVAGDFLYAANRNDKLFGPTSDSVATYAIDPRSGSLSFVESTDTHTYFPRTFQINRAGDLVAFGGQTSSTVAIVARDASTGRLGGLVATLAVGRPGTVNNEDGLSAVIWLE